MKHYCRVKHYCWEWNTIVESETLLYSQGWPIFGSLPQIWVSCKFQIWGNDPNLGQRLIFKLEIKWDNISSSSCNYSWTCPMYSRTFLCALLATTIRCHRNITKKHVLDNKNFSKYGKLTQIWSNFLTMKYWPKFGAILQLLGYLQYLKKKKRFSFYYWVRTFFLFTASLSYS